MVIRTSSRCTCAGCAPNCTGRTIDPQQGVPSGRAVAFSPDDRWVVVLNGSSTDGLQNTAGDAIKAAGWPNPARNNSTTREEDTTVIFYRSTEFEGIALIGLYAVLATLAFYE